MFSLKRTRYFEVDGKAVPSEEDEIWKRLAASANLSATESQVDDSSSVNETFDDLALAKVELQTLQELFTTLEQQKGLGVTYIPDMRSPEEFRLHQRQEKLVKADRKQKQMKEAGEVLKLIHQELKSQIRKERVFYRELMGLSHFHKVRCEPTALSPFSVDLSLQHGSFPTSSLIVELHSNADGHVVLEDDVPHQPEECEVIAMMGQVEEHHEASLQALSMTETVRVGLMKQYELLREKEEVSRRIAAGIKPDLNEKKIRIPEKNFHNVKTPTVSGKMKLSQEIGIESPVSNMMNLEFDPEDQELLESDEDSEMPSDSNVPDEEDDLMDSDMIEDDFKEKWFDKEELKAMMKVHWTLCVMEHEHLWEMCKVTLHSQANDARMRPKEHWNFIKAMELMEANDGSVFGSLLKANVFAFFVNCVYQLPPFLYHINICDLGLSNREKVSLLMKSSLDGEAEVVGRKLSASRQAEDEWLKTIEPRQFYKFRFRETAPKLKDLVAHFLQLVDHEETFKHHILPMLNKLHDRCIYRFERVPGIDKSEIWIEIPSKFKGWIFINGKQIHIHGLRHTSSVTSFIHRVFQSSEFCVWFGDVTA